VIRVSSQLNNMIPDAILDIEIVLAIVSTVFYLCAIVAYTYHCATGDCRNAQTTAE
jgi:hypothetical protein